MNRAHGNARPHILFLFGALFVSLLSTSHLQAQRSKNKEAETVDLSILDKRDALIPYLTASQKIEMFKLEEAIKDALSDRRSGEHLVNTKASSFDPDRNLKPLIERGTKLIQTADLQISEAQKQMVALLLQVDQQRKTQTPQGETEYTLNIEHHTLAEILTTQIPELLATCREAKYDTLFFDGVYLHNQSGTQAAPLELKNQIYDALVDADGTRFSVKIPVNFRLKSSSDGSQQDIFDYENATIFKDDKKALLAFELILPEGSNSALLSLKALDFETHSIIVQQLSKLTELDELLSLEPETAQDLAAEALVLKETAGTFKRLAQLSSPYRFEIQSADNQVELTTLLSYALRHHSELHIVDSAFIHRVYGKELASQNPWQGQASAHLSISEINNAGAHKLTAQAIGNDRILEAGSLQVQFPQ